MKHSEIKRLSKISLKSRKKTTRSTVRGISFGLILLIPIIFLTIGLYGNISKQLNANPDLIYANLPFVYDRLGGIKEVASPEATYVIEMALPNISKIKEFSKNNAIDEAIVAEQYSFPTQNSYNSESANGQYKKDSYKIDNADYKTLNYNSGNTDSQYVTVFDNKENNGKYIIDRYKDKVFKKGFDKGFYNGGKQQIILSELFVEMIGLNSADIYGKKLGFKYECNKYFQMRSVNFYYDDDNIVNNNFNNNGADNSMFANDMTVMFEGYEVVGIVDKDFSNYIKSISGYSTHLYSSSMWFSNESYLNNSGNVNTYTLTDVRAREAMLTPAWSREEEEQYTESLNIKKSRLAPVYNSSYGDGNIKSASDAYILCKIAFVVPQNYESMKSISSSYADVIGDLTTISKDGDYFLKYASNTYNAFSMVFQIFTYAAIILITVGGIILFAALVNLFNTIMHSVNSRRNYLGVMRAIGAKSKLIPRLYASETFTIFNRAMVWIGILATSICVGIKIGIDSLLKLTGDDIGGLKIGISWWYIPITIGIIAVLLYSIGYLFAYCCSKKVATMPIVDVLAKE